MLGEPVYELHIDVFTPDTIPMSRLAEYMTSFAELLGHQEHVHFTKITKGSAGVAARVDDIAKAKVDKRVDEVRYGAGSDLAKKAFRELDEKLAEDSAVGRILRGSAKLIEFPGKTRRVEEKLGPINQPGTLDGELIQIGGRDETINVHLKQGDQIYKCVASKAIARDLARHLFGGPIRARGKGTWARIESGAWLLKKFEICGFDPLDETPLSQVFAGLRERLVPPESGRSNPVDLVRQLRDD